MLLQTQQFTVIMPIIPIFRSLFLLLHPTRLLFLFYHNKQQSDLYGRSIVSHFIVEKQPVKDHNAIFKLREEKLGVPGESFLGETYFGNIL